MRDKRFTLPFAAVLAVVFVSLPINANATGQSTAPGQQPPSINSAGPSIGGATVVGQAVAANAGDWSGVNISYSYQWQRCDLSGNACSPVGGAVGTTYELAPGDVGYTFRVTVTASNKNGSVPATSDPSAVVAPSPAPAPVLTPAPAPVPTDTTTTTATTTTTSTTTTGTTAGIDPTIDGRWYSAASAFNTPIPANPPIHPDSAAMSDALATYHPYPWLGPTSSGVPALATATTSTPNVTVQLNFPSCDYKEFQVPIPAGTIVENVMESSLALMVPDGSEWDLFQVTSPGVTPLRYTSAYPQCPATSNWAATVVVHENPGWTGTGTGQGGYRGSSTAAGLGTIRPRDTQTQAGGTWDHAIGFAYHNTCSQTAAHPSYVYPAASGDGFTSSLGCMPMGARFQLDPSIDCATWPSLQTLGEWAKQECRTLQRYGAIIIDTGDAFATQYYRSTGSYAYPWDWSNPYVPMDLMSRFRVIDWTRWTG